MALCLYLELCKTHTKQGYAIKKNEELLNAATAGKK